MKKNIEIKQFGCYKAKIKYHRTDDLREHSLKDGSTAHVRFLWIAEEDEKFAGDVVFEVAEMDHWLPERDLKIIQEIPIEDYKKAAELKMYQIRFLDSSGCGYYEYFHTRTNPKKMAEIVATESLSNRRKKSSEARNGFMGMFSPIFKPVKTPTVVEYDNVTKGKKKGGLTFKLRLQYLSFGFRGGGSVREEWYKADEDE